MKVRQESHYPTDLNLLEGKVEFFPIAPYALSELLNAMKLEILEMKTKVGEMKSSETKRRKDFEKMLSEHNKFFDACKKKGIDIDKLLGRKKSSKRKEKDEDQ